MERKLTRKAILLAALVSVAAVGCSYFAGGGRGSDVADRSSADDDGKYQEVIVWLEEVLEGKPLPWRTGGPVWYKFHGRSEAKCVEVDACGNLYVSTFGTVYRIDRRGIPFPLARDEELKNFEGYMVFKNALGIDSLGVSPNGRHIWFSGDGVLYRLVDGAPELMAGERFKDNAIVPGKPGKSRLRQVRSIVVDDEGTATMACADAIIRCDLQGNLSILAGSQEKGYRDGEAKQAFFSWPRIVPHPQGGYWVAHEALSLRRFHEGSVSTVIRGVESKEPRKSWQFLPPLPVKGFDGIYGASPGPDRSLYVLELRSVSKVTPEGKMEKVLKFRGARGEGDWGTHDFAVLPDGSFVSTHFVYCH